jgi:hypothetical protein
MGKMFHILPQTAKDYNLDQMADELGEQKGTN